MRKARNLITATPASIAMILMLLLAPAAAFAKTSPGVHVDPGSPAAKEYSIPLGNARSGGSSSGGSGSSQLFGKGITKHTASPSTSTHTSTTSPSTTTSTPVATTPTSTKKRATHRHHKPRKSKSRRTKHSAAPATPPKSPPGTGHTASPQNEIGSHSSSGSGITWMLVAAVAVLLLGGLGGAFVSRRNRRADPFPSS